MIAEGTRAAAEVSFCNPCGMYRSIVTDFCEVSSLVLSSGT